MNLLSLSDWSRDQIEEVLKLADYVKKRPREYAQEMAGRTLLMMFQKPSLRTRVSFEVAMLQMGGHAVHYDLSGSPWAHGKETASDTARTASRYVDAIMARLYRQQDLVGLAEGATVPVINGLTDVEHPCQALGDLMTIRERFGKQRVKVAYVGDGLNNVTHSLMHGCGKMGLEVVVACPEDPAYAPDPTVMLRAWAFAKESGGHVDVVHDAVEAVEGASVVYTDTWMSYHVAEEERAGRMRDLKPFAVTPELMEKAAKNAVFMHCLPAQRETEVAAAVIDGPRSAVWEQAENRLHTEKAVLISLVR
jgi:ornithine carbamoyltransferase